MISNKLGFISTHRKEKSVNDDEDYSADFTRVLSELSNTYRKFPFYLIEIMAEDYNIPHNEIKILFDNFLRI